MPGVIQTLGLDVSPDGLFVNTDRTHEVTSRPNTVGAPLDLFEMRELFFQSPGSVGFEVSDNHPDAFGWWDGGKDMHVVLVGVYFFENNLGMVLRPGL